MKKPKENYLLEKIVSLFKDRARGDVLDLGCGNGDYSKRIKELGFKVTAADMDEDRFSYRTSIEFKKCDLAEKLLFPDNRFDYVLFLEVIEHLRNPYAVLKELNRVLKAGGILFISTPNILNICSRVRFLFTGAFDFFREPLLEQVISYNGDTKNLHLIPWKYQELEYALYENGFCVAKIYTDMPNPSAKRLRFLTPFLSFSANKKRKISEKKGGVSFRRINQVLLSEDLLYGRHLIIEATKK